MNKIKPILVSAAVALFCQNLYAADPVTSPTVQAKPQSIVFAERIDRNIEIVSSAADLSARHEIYSPGASFIKVHFNEFRLPAGVYVEVSNADGTEVYRYSKHDRSGYTYDSASGEDGRHSFAAMSISGDIARLSVVGDHAAIDKFQHRVEVDYFMEGFPEGSSGNSAASLTKTFAGKSTFDAGIESTCGVNERRDVECWRNSHPTEFERSRPVARLLIQGSSLCTAWRVGPDNRMFTNEHCVGTQSALTNTEVWFNYQNTQCGGGGLAGTTKVTGDQLLASDFNLDYTLFTVNNFANIESFGYFGLEPREANLGERIYIAQHGSGNPKELAIESDQNASGNCEIDDVTATGRAANTDMGYFCDTIGGSSGSPVLAASNNRAIALHHFGGCTNQGVKIVEIWPQVSGFFGGVVPAGDDEGPGNPGDTPPAAPSNLTADVTQTGRGRNKQKAVVLTWSDNSNDEDNFVVQRCQETGKGKNKVCNFTDHATVGANTTSFSESGLSGKYKYRVRAVNAFGSSANSNEVQI